MTLENRIPIKTYNWTHKDLEELLEDLQKKEYLVSEFCFQNNWYYDRSILLNIKDNGCLLTFKVYNLNL